MEKLDMYMFIVFPQAIFHRDLSNNLSILKWEL